METFLSYILTWRLPAGLLIAAIGIMPIRHAYRLVRTGDIRQKGAVEEMFLSSLFAALATAVYTPLGITIPVTWLCFRHKRLINTKGFLASMIAILVVALYYGIYLVLSTP